MDKLTEMVLELDRKRTQGDWYITPPDDRGFSDVMCERVNRCYHITAVDNVEYTDAQFIASAPLMAQIIRHQQELLEEAYIMVKNVDFCLEKDCVDMMRSYKTTELLKKLQPILTNKGEE